MSNTQIFMVLLGITCVVVCYFALVRYSFKRRMFFLRTLLILLAIISMFVILHLTSINYLKVPTSIDDINDGANHIDDVPFEKSFQAKLVGHVARKLEERGIQANSIGVPSESDTLITVKLNTDSHVSGDLLWVKNALIRETGIEYDIRYFSNEGVLLQY